MVAVSEGEKVLQGACCPTDESFLEFSSDYIADMARCGVDLIMLDDDFRYAFLAGNQMGCLCDNHMRMIEEMIGETLPQGVCERKSI
ncbi:MAG: hypothetical protein IJW55_10250 [Clostridia bacterium]|nr:hypothetical protein [Clostridia bacterium]MBQ7348329.1 hypothetical protein [Clostridia bacterium]